MTWRQAQLRRLFRIVNGGTPAADELNWGGEVRWATPIDLAPVDGGQLELTQRTISALGLLTGSRSVNGGSLVLSTRAPIGYVAHVSNRTAFNQGCRGLEPRSADVVTRFYLYVLLARRSDLQALGSGSTFMELSSEALGSLSVPVPPVREQSRTVEYLDAETARIDETVMKRRRLFELLEERVATVTASALGAAGFDSRWDGVPDRFGQFSMVRLGHVAEVRSGLTVDAARRFDGATIQVGYLRVANVHADRIDTADVKEVEVDPVLLRRHLLATGDVLMTEGGDIDKLGRGAVWDGRIVPCLHQNHVFAVRAQRGVLHPQFLALLTRTPYARAYFETTATKTTGIASTSSSKIRDFRIPLPTFEEQRSIVAEVGERLAAIRAACQAAGGQISLLVEHRRSLVIAAVQGEGTAA